MHRFDDLGQVQSALQHRVVALYFADTKYQFKTDLPPGTTVQSIAHLDSTELGARHEDFIRVLLRGLELPTEAPRPEQLAPIILGHAQAPFTPLIEADVHEALAALKRRCGSKSELRYQLAAAVVLNAWIESERRLGFSHRKKFYAFKQKVDSLTNWAMTAEPPGVRLWAEKNALSEVPSFAPEVKLQVVPAYMLHRLGVVTTPAIENLADICSTWAYFRYLWAFDIPSPGTVNPVLRLSEAARNIDFHQKGLLSDQIGVGIAAWLLGTYLNAPLATDVSVVMDDPTWPIDLQYDTSPDYLFFDATQTSLFIVECKGTQISRYTSVDQLCRGTEQVPSLTFTDGRTPPSLVVATCLSKRDARVLVLDPPGDDDLPAERHEKPERVSQREWKVRSDVEFSRATRLISEAKILSFAGDYQAAASKLEQAHTRIARTPRSLPGEPVIAENQFGIFRGVRQRVGLKDRFNIDVFQALDTSVYRALLSEEPARTDEELRTFQSRSAAAVVNVKPTQPVLATHENGALVVRSAGPDGSLLEVRVSPP